MPPSPPLSRPSTNPAGPRCRRTNAARCSIASPTKSNSGITIIAQIEALDAGKLEAQAQGDVANFVATIRYFAEVAQHISRRNTLAVKGHEAWTMRQPWGPCGFIFPWNFPFLLIGWGISPALAAGNTVVIKPAEDTPLSAIYLSHLAKEVGMPDGVINVVTGLGESTGAAVAGIPACGG